MSQRKNPGLSYKTKPAKRKKGLIAQRNLFAELSEGMKAPIHGTATERSGLTT